MGDLDVKERDLLDRIGKNAGLRSIFFRKVKGLRWLTPLEEAGYLDADQLPPPQPSEKEGYYTVPSWEVADFLVRTAPELRHQSNNRYAKKFIEIMSNATSYAREHNRSNHHAWWQFSKALVHVPHEAIELSFLDVVDYWIEDGFETDLVAATIGETWLVDLLNRSDKHAASLSLGLLGKLFKTKFSVDESLGEPRRTAKLRIDSYWAKKIASHVARKSGLILRKQSVDLFAVELTHLLDELGKDSWSSVWQPAIEDHEQNKHRDSAENILVFCLRESLGGYVDALAGSAASYLEDLFASQHQTLKRIGIHTVAKYPKHFSGFWESLIANQFFVSNYRHEMWHFLNTNYSSFDDRLKKATLLIINEFDDRSQGNSGQSAASAFEQSLWLAAIKDFGDLERRLYGQAVGMAGAEPEHPDFSTYMTVGWGTTDSPYSAEELGSLPISKLVGLLGSVTGGGHWGEPSIEGLTKALKQTFAASPLRYHNQLDSFLEVDFAYAHSIIDAYHTLWRDKKELPWDDIWRKLLSYVSGLIGQERFWLEENATPRPDFVANRHWLVSLIGNLLESATKSDDFAASPENNLQIELILADILEKQRGEEFSADGDAVFSAINSPRGQCLEALINLTLRSCRLAHQHSRSHEESWNHFRHYFDSELQRTSEYEFVTLVTNYLPNFLYLSRPWIIENLSSIFSENSYERWSCAMQGYAYVGTVYEDVYQYLKKSGDFERALDDEKLKDRVRERIVQHIAVAFLSGFESLEDQNSLVSYIVQRTDLDEISHLIWYLWAARKDGDTEARGKVFQLWTRIQNQLDWSTADGQTLASNLCHWAVFVDQLDAPRKELLLQIAPYAHVSYNSYELLQQLAVISRSDAVGANEIWRAMIGRRGDYYPDDAAREILRNLVSQGGEGIRAARDTVSMYIELGSDGPSNWLNEILAESLSSSNG